MIFPDNKNSLSSSIKKQEQEFFDHKYLCFLDLSDKNISSFRNNSLISFDKFLKFLPPKHIINKYILEIGCNDGRYLNYFLKKGAHLAVGTDLSLLAMKRGIKNKYFPVSNEIIPAHPNIYIQSDFDNPAFKNNSFDTILIIRSLHHFHDINDLIKNCFQLLKNNGFLIIVDPNGINPLRKIADYVGKYLGSMSQDEKSLGLQDVIHFLNSNNFAVTSSYSFNIISEPLLHLSEISYSKHTLLFRLFSFLLILANKIEKYLESAVLIRYPNVSWSYIVIAEKS